MKRVVGLPGEQVQIIGGDVFIDGEIASKSVADARAMAVQVHEIPPIEGRWQASSAWETRDGRFFHAVDVRYERNGGRQRRSAKPLDWIVYHHQRRAAAGSEPQASAVLDESPVDQNESRQCQAVTDLSLACELRSTDDGSAALRVRSAADEFLLRINLQTGEGELMQNGQALAILNASIEPFRSFGWLELAIVDHRVRALVNHKLLAEYEYQPTAPPPASANAPATAHADETAAVGAQGAEVEIRRLIITRDPYYTQPADGSLANYQLGPGEYFLLGDNSAHSLDSRDWSPHGIADTQLVGSVISW